MQCPHCGGLVVYDHENGYYVCSSCGTVFETYEFDSRSIISRKLKPVVYPSKTLGGTVADTKDARGNRTSLRVSVEFTREDYIRNLVSGEDLPQFCKDEIVSRALAHYDCIASSIPINIAVRALAYVLCVNRDVPQIFSSKYLKLGKPVYVVMQCLGIKRLEYNEKFYIRYYAYKYGIDDRSISYAFKYASELKIISNPKQKAILALLLAGWALGQNNIFSATRNMLKSILK